MATVTHSFDEEDAMSSIGFIGAGNMAEAIIGGIVKRKVYDPSSIMVYDIRQDRSTYLSSTLGVKIAQSRDQLVRDNPMLVVSVKPDKVTEVLSGLGDAVKGKCVISIAAGVSIGSIQQIIGEDTRVIRVMPNTPALVLEGASALAASKACSTEDIERAKNIFSSIGICLEMDEGLLNAVTALSGSGPAFCFMFIEALSDGGVWAGLPRDVAQQLAAATLRGAATMVLQTGKHPGELKDMVTSPSGTTIEGVSALESGAFRSAVMEAVFAAYLRAEDLGK